MLPTPDTSHVAFERIYEPAEDSFLLLDTLSSSQETAFLQHRFDGLPSPIVIEIGTGSGVVIAFVTAHAYQIFGRDDVLTLGLDINRFACEATHRTVTNAVAGQVHDQDGQAHYMDTIAGSLTSPLRAGTIDILIFNPPYVPTSEMPKLPQHGSSASQGGPTYDEDCQYLALSYAGGKDGMETTDRLIQTLPDLLSSKGLAYVLLCAQNRPRDVQRSIQTWGTEWTADIVSSSGRQAGWEKLVVLRIARQGPEDYGTFPT